MELYSVIQNDGPGKVLIWKCLNEDFNNNSLLIVAENEFGDAPNGAAIYSIMDPAADAQVELTDNKYTGTYLIPDKIIRN